MTIAAGRHRVVDVDILEYVAANSSAPDRVQLDLQRATQERTGGSARMQIGHDQAVMMETLVRATGSRNAIEVGTFTGYSALAIARGLAADGKLLCCALRRVCSWRMRRRSLATWPRASTTWIASETSDSWGGSRPITFHTQQSSGLRSAAIVGKESARKRATAEGTVKSPTPDGAGGAVHSGLLCMVVGKAAAARRCTRTPPKWHHPISQS